MDINKIYCMDNVEGMKQLESESIDLTVTSPPYDKLRQYNGYSFDFENLVKELYRTTKIGGVVVWVVGDSTIKGSESGTSFRQVLRFMDEGFKLHDTMIYEKLNPIPLNHKRYEQYFEYMFVFVKGKLKTFNPIMTDCKYKGTKQYRGRQKQYESTYSFKKVDKFTEVRDKKIIGNIWRYFVGGVNADTRTKHNAPFPEQLASDHILSWSNEGDLVLDPFMGSGTTAKMAKLLNRNYIGFEISQEYCDIANQRLSETNDNKRT